MFAKNQEEKNLAKLIDIELKEFYTLRKGIDNSIYLENIIGILENLKEFIRVEPYTLDLIDNKLTCKLKQSIEQEEVMALRKVYNILIKKIRRRS